jgi:hypothetical protein
MVLFFESKEDEVTEVYLLKVREGIVPDGSSIFPSARLDGRVAKVSYLKNFV